jgi:hypothetical protein
MPVRYRRVPRGPAGDLVEGLGRAVGGSLAYRQQSVTGCNDWPQLGVIGIKDPGERDGTMNPASQPLASRQADYAAVITVLGAVRERLRGQRISARTDDPEALARVAFMLIDIAVAVLLRQYQEAGFTEGEAHAAAIGWAEAQAAHMEIQLLESGAVFNPAASVLGYGDPGQATGNDPPPAKYAAT